MVGFSAMRKLRWSAMGRKRSQGSTTDNDVSPTAADGDHSTLPPIGNSELWIPPDIPDQQPEQVPDEKEDESGPRRECVVCRNDVLESRFSSKPPTARCNHDVTICKGCIASHVETDLNGKGNPEIKCPVVGCSEPLEYDEVRIAATPAVFQRYDYLVTRRLLQQDPSFRWCKSPGCGAGHLHESGHAAPIVTCPRCGAKSCFSHDVPWHDEETCDDYDIRSVQGPEAASTKTIQKVTKACPACNRPIEKTAGCDHMTCRPPGGCGHEFCWACRGPWKEIVKDGLHKHKPTCRYWEPRG